MEPGLAAVAYWAAPNLDPPDAEDRVASSGAHGLLVDVCSVEIDRDTGAVSVLDYVTVHDAGTLLNPMLADGQVRGGFAHGVAAALFERHVWDESGNLVTASFMDYLAPTAPDVPSLEIGHRSTPSPFTALGAKGLGEGNTMSAPVAIANAVADALGRDDLELPLTPPRVWDVARRFRWRGIGQGWRMKPPPSSTSPPHLSQEAVAALAEGGPDAKPIAGGQSLVPALNMRLVRPTRLVDIGRAGLDGIERENGTVRVGATATQRALERSERCPPLARQALPHVGHVGDPKPRHRRRVDRARGRRRRALPLPRRARRRRGHRPARDRARDFFVTHFTTVLEPGELVIATRWPVREEPAAFCELALRAGDYALSMVAVSGTTVAVGAVTDRPTVLDEVGALLAGEPRVRRAGARGRRARGEARRSAGARRTRRRRT